MSPAKRRDGESLDSFLKRLADAAPPEIQSAYFGRKAEAGEPMAFIEGAVAHKGDDCLIWPYATRPNGYGVVWRDGKRWPAHRLVLTLVQGPPPDETMDAAHAPVVCHNRRCVNPAHLRWATRQENHFDMDLDGTAVRYGQKARVTPSQVLAIRADPRTHQEVADAYGIGKNTVRHIRARRTWKHL